MSDGRCAEHTCLRACLCTCLNACRYTAHARTLLELFIATQRRDAESFWAPYIATLPTDFRVMLLIDIMVDGLRDAVHRYRVMVILDVMIDGPSAVMDGHRVTSLTHAIIDRLQSPAPSRGRRLTPQDHRPTTERTSMHTLVRSVSPMCHTPWQRSRRRRILRVPAVRGYGAIHAVGDLRYRSDLEPRSGRDRDRKAREGTDGRRGFDGAE